METNTDALKLRAYHESGHAVIAYLSGFSCNSLEITQRDPISNIDDYNLGKKADLIKAMRKYRDQPELYDQLPKVVRMLSRKTALKTIIVLLAGQAAELVYKNGGKAIDNPFLDMTGEDIRPADNIDYFLSVIKGGQHPMNYLKMLFRQVMELISSKEVWVAVSGLAEALYESPKRRLEKKDLEKILIETGYLQYLSRVKTGKSTQNKQYKSENKIETHQASPPVRSEYKSADSEPSENSVEQDRAAAFSREELLKLKEEFKKKPKKNIISKKEGIAKIANFAKGHKFVNFKIGMVDNLDQLKNIDKTRYVAFDVKDHAEARDILMYFVCMGMEVSPGSTQNKTAASIFVVKDEILD